MDNPNVVPKRWDVNFFNSTFLSLSHTHTHSISPQILKIWNWLKRSVRWSSSSSSFVLFMKISSLPLSLSLSLSITLSQLLRLLLLRDFSILPKWCSRKHQKFTTDERPVPKLFFNLISFRFISLARSRARRGLDVLTRPGWPPVPTFKWKVFNYGPYLPGLFLFIFVLFTWQI